MSEKFGLMALANTANQYLDGVTNMNCADTTAAAADREILRLLSECYDAAKALLAEHRDLLDEIALYLLQKETITGDEFMAYVNAYNRRLEGPDDPDALPEKTEHSTPDGTASDPEDPPADGAGNPEAPAAE